MVRTLICLCCILATAGVASASSPYLPSPTTSTVEREGQNSPGVCDPNTAVICPASDLGLIEVIVTVRDCYGTLLSDDPVTCSVVPVADVCGWCAGETPQDGVSDINGQAFFYFTYGGGCCTVCFGAVCKLVQFIPSPAITIISPDRNGDRRVNLNDFIQFASSYLTEDQCFDFDCNGTVALPDFIIFASHYQHGCP